MAWNRLSADQWERIRHVFSKAARTGCPPRDRRTIVDGILWIVRSGAPWRDLPEEFGPWATEWDVFDKWSGDGTLDEILGRLQADHLDAGEIDEEL